MPPNIAMASFVLGAVLLLVALLKGGFKIFGAEVSGTSGVVARVVAGIAGSFLLLIGLGMGLNDWEREQVPKKADNPPAQPISTLRDGERSETGLQRNASDIPTSKKRFPDRSPSGEKELSSKEERTATLDLPDEKPDSELEARAARVEIGGYWRDNMGAVYQIMQDGDAIRFTGQWGVAAAQGRGRLRQREAEVEYQTNAPSTGHGVMVVSPDGHQMVGTFHEEGPAGSQHFQRLFFRYN